MGWKNAVWIGALAVVVMGAGTVQADRTRAHVVRGDYGPPSNIERIPVDRDRTDVHIIQRRVVEPAATVDRELSEQPVRPHLVELQVGMQRIMVDPAVQYRDRRGGLDRNHSLMQAQRQFRARQARGAHVIRNEAARSEAQARDARVMPRAIFLRPDLLERRQREQAAPSVPEVQNQEQDRNQDKGEAPQPHNAQPIPNVPASPEDIFQHLVDAG